MCGEIDRRAWIVVEPKRRKKRRRKRPKAVNQGLAEASSDQPTLTSSDSEAGGDAEPMTESAESTDNDQIHSALQSSIKGSGASSSIRPAPPTPPRPPIRTKR